MNINDFTCMISAAMYRKVVVPYLESELAMLEASVYHLDGSGAIQHLDAIFEQPKVRAIQWVPGAGRDDVRAWIPLLQRIQQNKRSVYMYCRPEEIPLGLDSLRPEGLMIECRCNNETDARALLQFVMHYRLPKNSFDPTISLPFTISSVLQIAHSESKLLHRSPYRL